MIEGIFGGMGKGGYLDRRSEADVTIVDLAFSLRGATVPRDHGYRLYGAVSRKIPAAHGAPWLGIHPLGGRPVEGNKLDVGAGAGLRCRLPVERVGTLLPLAGATLDLEGSALRLGPPVVHPLLPAACLDSRIVVVKLTGIPRRRHPDLDRESLDRAGIADRTLSELTRQLHALGIESPLQLCGHQRITVAGRRILGFSVRVDGLSAEQSLRLQEHGLGGKRRMGCGLFRPTRGR